MLTLLAAALAGAAALLAGAPRPSLTRRRPPPASSGDEGPGFLRRHRGVVAVLAGIGAASVVGGTAGLAVAAPAAAAAWVVVSRAEAPAVRRRAEEIRRDLPTLVTLLGAALRSGAAPGEALEVVAAALPGPASASLGAVAARLRLGDDPVSAWASLARDPQLGPLGRALGRAQETGSPVVVAVERLGHDLTAQARSEVEDRARSVGVRAAVPLGLCLLPAFVLLGIVPLVAGLVGSLRLGG